MDTSKEYIEMCRKAEEIQITSPYEIGDYYYLKKVTPNYGDCVAVLTGYDDRYLFLCNDEGFDCKTLKSEDKFWKLFRQDQLQGMLNKPTNELMVKLFSNGQIICLESNRINSDPEEVEKTVGEIINQYSIEQIWLMIVMKEKYNKTWNGSDWINETNEHGRADEG